MSELWADFAGYVSTERLMLLARAVLLVVLGLTAAKLLVGALKRLTADRLEQHHATLLRRAVFYLVAGVFVLAALHQLGFNLSVLLGAAGIVTLALGFASQTAASNLISGLFLIAERPFAIGDVIHVGGTTGEVLSIDLLSVKLRTFDNLFVRIPNETLIKTEVRTLTKFPIRRADLEVGVAYKEDIPRVRDILLDVADRNPLCLAEPEPLFLVRGFGDSSIQILFGPWATRENYVQLKNSMQLEIKQRFDAEGIEIPFPQRSLRPGSDIEPFPVRLVGDEQ